MLKPTEELVKEVMHNAEIKEGIEDAEIMAAVQDIAMNPSAFKKYKDNKKVVAFYSHMGKLMESKIKQQDTPSKS